jgi:hypothetical protein
VIDGTYSIRLSCESKPLPDGFRFDAKGLEVTVDCGTTLLRLGEAELVALHARLSRWAKMDARERNWWGDLGTWISLGMPCRDDPLPAASRLCDGEGRDGERQAKCQAAAEALENGLLSVNQWARVIKENAR